MPGNLHLCLKLVKRGLSTRLNFHWCAFVFASLWEAFSPKIRREKFVKLTSLYTCLRKLKSEVYISRL
jgi:hypothetical protein